jgi:hypothetical protein
MGEVRGEARFPLPHAADSSYPERYVRLMSDDLTNLESESIEIIRNMATGASTSELAVLVMNASKGLQTQTHRHARIVALLGIRLVQSAEDCVDRILSALDSTSLRRATDN